MKKFLVFSGYEDRGVPVSHNFNKAFETLEDAEKYIIDTQGKKYNADYVEVLNTETLEFISYDTVALWDKKLIRI